MGGEMDDPSRTDEFRVPRHEHPLHDCRSGVFRSPARVGMAAPAAHRGARRRQRVTRPHARGLTRHPRIKALRWSGLTSTTEQQRSHGQPIPLFSNRAKPQLFHPQPQPPATDLSKMLEVLMQVRSPPEPVRLGEVMLKRKELSEIDDLQTDKQTGRPSRRPAGSAMPGATQPTRHGRRHPFTARSVGTTRRAEAECRCRSHRTRRSAPTPHRSAFHKRST